MARLKERALRFGEDQRLLGILTVPATPLAGLPTVIIPNTGIDHRVGPNRLHVQLARALGAAGYCTLRFDLSGLGDSDAPRGAAPDASRDLQDAVSMLLSRQHGPQFLLIGLCSGAHDIHQFAKNSLDVMGALFIDGYAYPTPRFKRRRFMQRLLRLHRKAAETLPSLLGDDGESLATQGPASSLAPEYFRQPAVEEASADFTTMLSRGIHLAFLFTGDMESEYNYAEQHFDVFPQLKGYAEVWYQPKTDHTLSRRTSREALVQHIREWMGRLRD